MSRRPSGRRRVHRVSIPALAGWLFADMLLVLFIVSIGGQADPLAAQQPSPSVAASPSPSPSANPSPSESPSPSPTPLKPRAVDRNRVDFHVSGEDRAALVEQIRAQAARYPGRQAAIVLTFGGGQAGTVYAGLVNSVLGTAAPELFTAETVAQDFLKLGDTPQTATLWIYFFST